VEVDIKLSIGSKEYELQQLAKDAFKEALKASENKRNLK